MRSDCFLSSGRSTLWWAMLHDSSSMFVDHRFPPEQVLHDPFPAHRVWSGCMASAVSVHVNQGTSIWNVTKSSAATILSLWHKARLGWRVSAAKKLKPLPFMRILAAWWVRDLDLGGGRRGHPLAHFQSAPTRQWSVLMPEWGPLISSTRFEERGLSWVTSESCLD